MTETPTLNEQALVAYVNEYLGLRTEINRLNSQPPSDHNKRQINSLLGQQIDILKDAKSAGYLDQLVERISYIDDYQMLTAEINRLKSQPPSNHNSQRINGLQDQQIVILTDAKRNGCLDQLVELLDAESG